jgi:hypothetical protein
MKGVIGVRNDDILITSSDWGNPFLRFKEIHEWIQEVTVYPVMHVPTILTEDIQQFPECVEYIKYETEEGRMDPQLHGVTHTDPGSFGYDGLIEQLKIGKGWMEDNLGVTPTRYYTPHGAGEAVGQEWLWKASTKCKLEMITCDGYYKMNGRFGVVQILKEGKDPIEFLDGNEIFMHWWNRGQRLQRILKAIEAGSWEAAHGPVTD